MYPPKTKPAVTGTEICQARISRSNLHLVTFSTYFWKKFHQITTLSREMETQNCQMINEWTETTATPAVCEFFHCVPFKQVIFWPGHRRALGKTKVGMSHLSATASLSCLLLIRLFLYHWNAEVFAGRNQYFECVFYEISI